MEDKTVLSEKQAKQVTGGDGTEMIPRTSTPRCPECKSSNVTLVFTMYDKKHNKRISDYRCEKCEHIFRRERYEIYLKM